MPTDLKQKLLRGFACTRHVPGITCSLSFLRFAKLGGIYFSPLILDLNHIESYAKPRKLSKLYRPFPGCIPWLLKKFSTSPKAFSTIWRALLNLYLEMTCFSFKFRPPNGFITLFLRGNAASPIKTYGTCSCRPGRVLGFDNQIVLSLMALLTDHTTKVPPSL